MNLDCSTCRSISGERRISPGPTVYGGRYWLIEHAYPTRLKGWLVIHHGHFHVVAKKRDLPDEFKDTQIYALINVPEAEALPREEVAALCKKLRSRTLWN